MLPNSAITAMQVLNLSNNSEENVVRIEAKWDFKNDDFFYDKSKNPIMLTTKKEIVKQHIIKSFWVNYNAWRVYYKDKTAFGVGIYKYKGTNPYMFEFALSEIKRNILEAISKHKYIKRVENYYGEFEEDKVSFEFDVILYDNEIVNINEVIIW